MALSRRMAAPFFIVLLVIVVAAETATAKDAVHKKLCLSQNPVYKDPLCKNDKCNVSCRTKKFIGGECKNVGILEKKCFCKKAC